MKKIAVTTIFVLCVCLALKSFSQEAAFDEAYILKTTKSNSQAEILNLKKRYSYVSLAVNFSDKGVGTSGVKNISEAVVVSLKEEVAKIFDPENQPCPLPGKVASKLKKMKEGGQYWAPKDVVDNLSQMPDSVLFIPRSSISNILHTVTVHKANKTAYKWLLTNSPTYNNLEVEKYILSGYSNFFYSLDCSGYLNAAISGSAALPGAEIKSSASSALSVQNSLFIAFGVVASPLYAAFYGNVPMDTASRLAILNAILTIPQLSDDDKIEMDLKFDAIWSSKNGSSNFNGKADIKGGGGGGFGIVQISASGEAGGTMARKSSFNSFNTYLVRDNSNDNPANYVSVSDVKALIVKLSSKNRN